VPVQDNLLGSIHIPTSARHNSFKFWKKEYISFIRIYTTATSSTSTFP